MARIKTMELNVCKIELKKLWEEWRYLEKSRTRVAGKRREKCRENLDKLWDIGASDAIELIQKTDYCTPLKKLRTLPSRHVPRSQKDPRFWIPRTQDPGSCWILDLIFSFSHGILEILDLVTTTFSWDPRDPGSRTKIFCWILEILDPAWAICRGILQILDLTQQ